ELYFRSFNAVSRALSFVLIVRKILCSACKFDFFVSKRLYGNFSIFIKSAIICAVSRPDTNPLMLNDIPLTPSLISYVLQLLINKKSNHILQLRCKINHMLSWYCFDNLLRFGIENLHIKLFCFFTKLEAHGVIVRLKLIINFL